MPDPTYRHSKVKSMLHRRLKLPISVFVLVFCSVPILVGAQKKDGARPDTSTLVHPEVAERLSLQDSQRAAIQKLLQGRAEAMATAPDANAKTKVRQDFDEKILSQLSEEQKGKFSESVAPQRLMFQFREMKWGDVLQWFAEQQDLTLVMDRTPPGTFTYSDTRTYSPNEGIDLLNSVLMTRDFALIRRDKMLMVMELSDAIPLELLPRVKLEELPQRGKFELVSVVFPLAGRPVDVALSEVKPYLNRYGRSIPLARGTQLLVVETAGKMQTINEIISSIPLPKAAPEAQPPKPAPKPIFKSYSLGKLDASRALETIKKLVPSEQMTVDSKSAVLNGYLIPEHHEIIEALIEQMKSLASDAPTTESVAYQFAGVPADELRKQIQNLVSKAIVTTIGDRLLVVANAEEQKLVQSSLAAMDILPVNSRNEKEARLFELDSSLASSAETSLKALLPKCQVVANATGGGLVVRGSKEELETAEQIIEYWKASKASRRPIMRTIDLDTKADSKWLVHFDKLVPNAKLWLSDEGQKLLVMASEDEIKLIEESLPALKSLLQKKLARSLQIYTLSKIQASRRSMLSELPPTLADIKMVDGSIKGELYVWATAEQHRQFTDLLNTLEGSLPQSMPTIPKTYGLDVRETSVVQQLLANEFPEAKITLDSDGTTLTVLTDEGTHTKIQERIALFNEQLPKKSPLELKTYSVRGMTASALQTSLAPLLAKARVNLDAEKQRLLVQADATTHREIEMLVSAMSEKQEVDQQKVVVPYRLEQAVPSQVKTLLEQLSPGTTLIADDKLKQIVATGTIEAHAMIKSTIAQIDRSTPGRNDVQLRAYDAKKLQAASLLPMLQKLWPDMQLSVDSAANRIIASGTPADLDQIHAAMERLIAAPDGSPQFVKTYAAPAGEMTSLAVILGQIAPQALISSDIATRTITVWANEEQHGRVQQALEQIAKTAQSLKEPATYYVKPAQVTAVQTAIVTLFPTASVAPIATTGQLVVVATSDQQKKIASVIDQLTNGQESADRSIRVFRFESESIDFPSLVAGLQATLPSQIRLEPSTTNQTLLVIGTPEELEMVSKKIDELKIHLRPAENASSVLYRIRHASLTYVKDLLLSVAPKATVGVDLTTKTLAITAKSSDHKKIEEFLSEFDVEKEAVTYSVRVPQVASIYASLKALFPYVEMTSDSVNGQIVVVGTQAQQSQCAQLIESVSKGLQSNDKTVRAFRVDQDRIDTASFLSSLTATVPSTVKIETNRNGSLIAIGTREELDLVATKLEELQKNIPVVEPSTSVVYKLQHGNPASADIILKQLVSRAVVVPDIATKSISVYGRPSDHKRVEDFLKSFDQPRSASTFLVKPTQVTAAMAAMKALFPNVDASSDPVTGQIIAIASEPQQAEIAKVIEMLGSSNQNEEKTLRVFRFDSDRMDVSSFATLLQSTLPPQVRVEADRTGGTILVAGTTSQLASIETKMEEIQRTMPVDTRTSSVYRLVHSSPTAAFTVLQSLLPRASIAQDLATRSIAVTGRPQDHQKIKEFLAAYDIPRNANLETHVYRLNQSGARSFVETLKELLPEATLYGSRDEGVVVATATPEQHKRIEQIVSEYEAGKSAGETRVFPIKKATALSLRTALLNFSTKTTVTADVATNSLIVTAPKAELDRIEKIVQDIDASSSEGRDTKFYSLETSDPRAFAIAIAESLPKAKFSADTTGGGVFATASPEEHAIIAELIEDLNAQPMKIPSLKTYILRHANPETVSVALTGAFGRRSTAGVTFSREGKCVYVVGTPTEQKIAKEIVQQVDVPRSAEDGRSMRVFPLGGADGKSISASIEDLFKDSPKPVSVKVDAARDRIFVTGSKEQLKGVEEALKQLSPPHRDFEIITLSKTDPWAFKSTADNLFSSESLNDRPAINVDFNTQQLLIQATKEQLQQIHQLMTQLGESYTPPTPPVQTQANSSNLRIVPIPRTNRRLLDDIQKAWPQLRSNPINIVDPKELRDSAPLPSGKESTGVPNPLDKDLASEDLSIPSGVRLVGTPLEAVSDQEPKTQPEKPPVIVVLGDEQWTLASEDLAALDQFTKLIETLKNPRIEPILNTGNYSIYLLRHADAYQMEKLLSSLFISKDKTKSGSFFSFGDQMKIVADPRINALIIGGNRNDRKVIEEMLGVFDSRDLIETLQALTPTIVTLQNATAKSVSTIVDSVYKSQLSSGAGKDPLEIPEGISSEFATILQQINAQSSGPLLTAAIDESTNSIILRGPAELTAEVKGFIERLDQQAGNSPSRRVQVLRLESTNTKNLEKALKILMAK